MTAHHLLTLQSIRSEQLQKIIDLALHLKNELKIGKPHPILAGMTLGMIFQKPSNRTRVSFEVGMYQLGGHALNIRPNEISMGNRETPEDVAKIFSRFVDLVMIRAFRHQDIVDFAAHSDVPVINGLSDLAHPCQAVADVMTMIEKKGPLEKLKIVYLGDGNNVCHSLINACGLLGGKLVVSTPRGYEPNRLAAAYPYELVEDPSKAVSNAHVVYTDVWTSMGQEEETEKRKKIFYRYQVNSDLMAGARPDAIFMHCLPAHRGEEVSKEIMDSPQSVVFDQAENRLHVQKAIMVELIHGFNYKC